MLDKKIAAIRNLSLLFFLIVGLKCYGQDATALFTKATLKIDGNIEEEWDRVSPSSPFWEYFPADTLLAKQQTKVKFLYDNQYLYVSIEADKPEKNYITPSLRRDFSSRNSDSVTLVLDTFNDGTNAFLFGTNPEGVQREALISNGGNNFPGDFNRSWDVKWQVEVVKTETG